MQTGTCSLKVDRESERSCADKDVVTSVSATNDDSDDCLSKTRPWSEVEDTIDEVSIPVTTR